MKNHDECVMEGYLSDKLLTPVDEPDMSDQV
jgi:hypothetical protein